MIYEDNYLEQKLTRYRRDFHKYPEVGWTEFRTSSKIAEKLLKMGYEVRLGHEIIAEDEVLGSPDNYEIEKAKARALKEGADPVIIKKMNNRTGVLGILDTGKPGPTIAFRFDIDAIEVTEAKNKNHKPYREGFASKHEGIMHACGHDGHTAVGLVLAENLFEIKDELIGKIKLIFQPGEEGGRGANAMIKAGIVDDVDYFFACHLGFGKAEEKDTYLVARAIDFLATTKFKVEFFGQSSHASANPEKGKNALLGACNAAINLHMIPPHSKGKTRINVGFIESGTAVNVIPDKAVIKVETRGVSNELNTYMTTKAKNIIEACANMYDLNYEIKKNGMAASENGDKDLSNMIADLGREMGFKNILKEQSLGASDNATLFMKRVKEKGGKSLYYLIVTPIAAPHHNSYFDFDEHAMVCSTVLATKIIKKICGKS